MKRTIFRQLPRFNQKMFTAASLPASQAPVIQLDLNVTPDQPKEPILPLVDPNSLDYIIYHKDCADGFGARFAAQLLLAEKATYVAANYFDEPLSDAVLKGKRVGMFDFSFHREIIERWRQVAELVIVVDHHKTAQEALAGLDQTHFDMDTSGARLAWEFFHPGKPVPRFIAYIEDRDLWRFKLPQSREFSAFFKTVPFEYNAYKNFYDNEHLVDEAITKGIQLMAVVTSKVNAICSTAILRTFRDTNLKALVVNSWSMTSEVGAELVARDCDFGLMWFYEFNHKACRVSLRSCDAKADVSEIARRFGGGGHRNAAGFMLNAKSVEGLFK